MFENFLESVTNYGHFTKGEQEMLCDVLKPQSVKKGELLLKQGDVSRTTYFIQQGSVRHYRDIDGFSEMTANLFIEGDWVLDHKSFTSQKPSANHIQAFEDCELLEFSMNSMHELISKSPSFFRLGKILDNPRNLDDLKLMSPEERYNQLMETNPRLIQRFPLKHIASYLNMTPETLSRVRAKF
ncbi:Crp/Fnr family transcriptional regulator [Roseivirga sp.]|uniref:Crp/Fnr family transcriptional regulator n=1 Tax=Roseivirga sp. TaxID=1964215 RepID=UPI003B8AC932